MGDVEKYNADKLIKNADKNGQVSMSFDSWPRYFVEAILKSLTSDFIDELSEFQYKLCSYDKHSDLCIYGQCSTGIGFQTPKKYQPILKSIPSP